jgi:hypothetical protein
MPTPIAKRIPRTTETSHEAQRHGMSAMKRTSRAIRPASSRTRRPKRTTVSREQIMSRFSLRQVEVARKKQL